MSYWFDANKKDISMSDEGDEIHILFKNDREGNWYVSVKTDDIRNMTNPSCPEDCKHKQGRYCIISAYHCIRMAEDFYKPKQIFNFPVDKPTG